MALIASGRDKAILLALIVNPRYVALLDAQKIIKNIFKKCLTDVCICGKIES